LRYTLKLLSFATAPCRGRDAPVRPRVSTVKRAKVARAIPLEEHAHDSSHAHHAGVARRPGDRRGAAALADAGPDAGGSLAQGDAGQARQQEGGVQAARSQAHREARGQSPEPDDAVATTATAR